MVEGFCNCFSADFCFFSDFFAFLRSLRRLRAAARRFLRGLTAVFSTACNGASRQAAAAAAQRCTAGCTVQCQHTPQQQRGAHIPAGQTARTGPGSEAADQHRRCGKGRYIPEKAAQRALPQCKAHGIPHARQQAAQPKAPQHIPQHRPRGR